MLLAGAARMLVHPHHQGYCLGLQPCGTMIAAAEQEVDATPMEGFNPAAVDEILGLSARGLRSTVILPLGYREADKDWLVNMKKVRRTNEKFITEVK